MSEKDAQLFNMRVMFSFSGGGRPIGAGVYKRITRNNMTVMSNTPAEIDDHMDFIEKAKEGEKILINGLGLGVALTEITKSEKITSITVIEKSKDVIKLVAPSFSDDERISIIHADAFTWKPPKNIRYSAVWHDIWDSICGDNLPEMTKLHRKYGKRTDWQGSWAKELCKRR